MCEPNPCGCGYVGVIINGVNVHTQPAPDGLWFRTMVEILVTCPSCGIKTVKTAVIVPTPVYGPEVEQKFAVYDASRILEEAT